MQGFPTPSTGGRPVSSQIEREASLTQHQRDRRCRKPPDQQRGQALVEFALVIPLFLLLIFAVIDFAWAFRNYAVVTNASREGARVGAVQGTESDITAATVSKSDGLLTNADVSVSNAQGAEGSSVVVTADYDYEYITPLGSIISLLSGSALPDPLPMQVATSMRLE